MDSIVPHLVVGCLIRLLAIAYSVYHDANNLVKYTDIDYSVYSDAARYVVSGDSPYRRETYRYTPLLALMLTPNITLHNQYGKVLFTLFDILASYIIYSLALLESLGNKSLSKKCTYLWIYNPLPVVICSRGSSESIILCLVLSTLYLHQKRLYGLCGILYGFSVHFKIYPVAYCVPLYLCADSGLRNVSLLTNIFKVNQPRIRLVVGSIIGFAIPTGLCYLWYGDEFLQETYFYHVTRKDIKHNFSLYFYMLYLNWNTTGILGTVVSVLTFAPQAILMLAVAILFRSPSDLCFVVFVQTYCFVVFNKVCTSQYFLWYLSLIPILYPKLKLKVGNAAILLFVWYFAQIAWLLPAYFLEFEGRNAFMYVWLESIAFFCANVGILVQIIKNYSPDPIYSDRQ